MMDEISQERLLVGMNVCVVASDFQKFALLRVRGWGRRVI